MKFYAIIESNMVEGNTEKSEGDPQQGLEILDLPKYGAVYGRFLLASQAQTTEEAANIIDPNNKTVDPSDLTEKTLYSGKYNLVFENFSLGERKRQWEDFEPSTEYPTAYSQWRTEFTGFMTKITDSNRETALMSIMLNQKNAAEFTVEDADTLFNEFCRGGSNITNFIERFMERVTNVANDGKINPTGLQKILPHLEWIASGLFGKNTASQAVTRLIELESELFNNRDNPQAVLKAVLNEKRINIPTDDERRILGLLHDSLPRPQEKVPGPTQASEPVITTVPDVPQAAPILESDEEKVDEDEDKPPPLPVPPPPAPPASASGLTEKPEGKEWWNDFAKSEGFEVSQTGEIKKIEGTLPLFLDKKALEEAKEWAGIWNGSELGGWLIGYQDEYNGHPYLRVTKIFEDKGKGNAITFNSESMTEAVGYVREAKEKGEKVFVVGFFHTHPQGWSGKITYGDHDSHVFSTVEAIKGELWTEKLAHIVLTPEDNQAIDVWQTNGTAKEGDGESWAKSLVRNNCFMLTPKSQDVEQSAPPSPAPPVLEGMGLERISEIGRKPFSLADRPFSGIPEEERPNVMIDIIRQAGGTI